MIKFLFNAWSKPLTIEITQVVMDWAKHKITQKKKKMNKKKRSKFLLSREEDVVGEEELNIN